MIGNEVGVPYPTIESIVEIYARHGFDVVGCRRAGKEGSDYHRIRFAGKCPDAGVVAIEIANAHGLRLLQDSLQEDWTLKDEDRVDGTDCPLWQLNFVPVERESGRGGIQCDCEVSGDGC